MTRTVLLSFAASALFCGAAGAAVIELSEEEVFGAPMEEDRDYSPGAVTVIRPAEKKGEQKNLPDLLESVPGLRVIRLNGRNGYSVASVRGSTSSQVAVYADGVLINLQSEAAVDLSAIPADGVERVEVYRGYIPARFGAQAMGGVINVVTKSPSEPETLLSLGAGSYGRSRGSVSRAERLGAGSGKLFAALNYEASDGDYKYFNDNGTPYTPEDDYAGKRRDNAFENADALLKWEDGHWKLKGAWIRRNRDLPLAAPGMDRRDGLPQRRGAILGTEKYEFSAGRRQTSGAVEWGLSANYVNQSKKYDSRRGEAPSQIGGAYVSKSRYRGERFSWALDANAAAGRSHFTELLLEGYSETLNVDGDGLYQYLGGISGYRYEGFDFQLQDSIALDRAGSLVLTPSLRWHKQDGLDKTTWQIGLRKDFGEHWSLKATGGTYARAPNMYERYGDGAYILPAGNGLSWEEGKQWDAGLRWSGRAGRADLYAEVTCFGRESRNLIEFDMESPRFARYRNIAESHVNGVEIEGGAEWGSWKLAVSGTYLGAVNDTPDDSGAVRFEGKRLPNRPEWTGTARLTRTFSRGSAYAEVQYSGANYGDSSEKIFFDARTLWNAGIKYALSPSASLFVGVDDIFDQADDWKLRAAENGPARMLWHPTEGRYFYVTLEWKF
ncbi:MAG: TonB-dependent receptor [Synergistaceae bacterium]|jgi:outer membrane cobalamin receptor|nr:TonB-dependent receptor [Synergistaceae bacterium]